MFYKAKTPKMHRWQLLEYVYKWKTLYIVLARTQEATFKVPFLIFFDKKTIINHTKRVLA